MRSHTLHPTMNVPARMDFVSNGAHHKRQVMGREVVVAVTEEGLDISLEIRQ